MKTLIPNTLKATIPNLYETEKVQDKICHVKLFNPNGVGTWYIVELDKETNEAFGYVELGGYPELGYFSLTELEIYRGPLGLGIERDLYFRPTLWSEIEKTLK